MWPDCLFCKSMRFLKWKTSAPNGMTSSFIPEGMVILSRLSPLVDPSEGPDREEPEASLNWQLSHNHSLTSLFERISSNETIKINLMHLIGSSVNFVITLRPTHSAYANRHISNINRLIIQQFSIKHKLEKNSDLFWNQVVPSNNYSIKQALYALINKNTNSENK